MLSEICINANDAGDGPSAKMMYFDRNGRCIGTFIIKFSTIDAALVYVRRLKHILNDIYVKLDVVDTDDNNSIHTDYVFD